MALVLRIHPQAEAELAEAIRWYEQRDPRLALDFTEAVEESLTAIQQHPQRYPVVHRQTRRAIIRRFPYGIFFAAGPQELRIQAIYHLSRDPKGWRLRK